MQQGGEEKGARGEELAGAPAEQRDDRNGDSSAERGRQAASPGGPRQSGSLECKHLFPIMEKPLGFLFQLSSFLEDSLPSPLGPEPFTEPDSSRG